MEKKMKSGSIKSKDDRDMMLNFMISIGNLIDNERAAYLAKANFTYVKSIAKQRSRILNDTLDVILKHFPHIMNVRDAGGIIENFFLTDHVVENDDGDTSLPSESHHFRIPNPVLPVKTLLKHVKRVAIDVVESQPFTHTSTRSINTNLSSPVIPISHKVRRTLSPRIQGAENELEVRNESSEPIEIVEEQSFPLPTALATKENFVGDFIENRPLGFLALFFLVTGVLKFSSLYSVTLDCDILLFLVFASFCLGMHIPKESKSANFKASEKKKSIVSFTSATVVSKPSTSTTEYLLRRSIQASPKLANYDNDRSSIMTQSESFDGQEDQLIKSPLDMFPPGAKLGSHFNCWSMPTHTSFHVRGSNYFVDRKKVESGQFLFPTRGVDLFLTDTCPENIGTNSGVMGGALRDKPTLIVNFRLPWGVFISYSEIPERFIPFVRKRYEFDYDGPIPDVKKMSPSERCVCRFLEADQETKNKTLKIVPVVVEGPWIVKSVVGGKPAIIGNKLPVNWCYEKATNNKALYLEADLDIVSSSAARGILSVARSHTNVLTLDLGFVVQANEVDELPEQMTFGVRLHGIDPCTASPLPPMKNHFINTGDDDSASSGAH
jgi:Protein ENHANCED DISEASE RESISTANCE 2, C-terminal